MRVGIDLDGVVHDYHGRVEDLYLEWFDREIEGDRSDWHWPRDLTHFEDYREMAAWFARAGGWDNMPYVPGAPGAIDSLLKDGHQIAFITARQDEGAVASEHWHRSSPWARTTQLHTNMPTKQNVACSVYVDDSPSVLASLLEAGKTVIAFDRPWNQSVAAPRARNWGEVLEFIEILDV